MMSYDLAIVNKEWSLYVANTVQRKVCAFLCLQNENKLKRRIQSTVLKIHTHTSANVRMVDRPVLWYVPYRYRYRSIGIACGDTW